MLPEKVLIWFCASPATKPKNRRKTSSTFLRVALQNVLFEEIQPMSPAGVKSWGSVHPFPCVEVDVRLSAISPSYMDFTDKKHNIEEVSQVMDLSWIIWYWRYRCCVFDVFSNYLVWFGGLDVVFLMFLALGRTDNSGKKKQRKHLYCQPSKISCPFCGKRSISHSAQVSNPMELLALIELAGQWWGHHDGGLKTVTSVVYQNSLHIPTSTIRMFWKQFLTFDVFPL